MKRLFLSLIAIATCISMSAAVANNTVEVVFNGSTATITIANNIKNYVTVKSGSSSHVIIVQDENFAGVNGTIANPDGEIYYSLSGSSSDGEFRMEGAYKATVELHGLTLKNPSGPAINIQNGKRIELIAKKETVNTLEDGVNEDFNGCYHCKGHTKIKGKGTLNVKGNSKHAIYSKEYIEIKNLTLNISSAVKDGIHCKQYFLMESGTVTLAGVQDDGIQVELKDEVSTGVKTDHEDEDTGNFYMTGGILTITSPGAYAIKTYGKIFLSGGTFNFDKSNIIENVLPTAIASTTTATNDSPNVVYDLNGRLLPRNAMKPKGIYIIKENGMTRKFVNK